MTSQFLHIWATHYCSRCVPHPVISFAYKFHGAVFTQLSIDDLCTTEHMLISFLHPGRSAVKTPFQVRNHWTSPASFAIEKKAESLLASSFAGESASMRFPSERRTIRSLSMIVFSRCAIVMIVQWRNSFLIVAWIRSSVSRSIAAVASSKTITLLCLRIIGWVTGQRHRTSKDLRHALAKQRSCLCPTERLSPPSLIWCSKPPGKLATSVVRKLEPISNYCCKTHRI